MKRLVMFQFGQELWLLRDVKIANFWFLVIDFKCIDIMELVHAKKLPGRREI